MFDVQSLLRYSPSSTFAPSTSCSVAPPDISAKSTDDGGVPAYMPNTAQPHGPNEEEEDSHTENDTPRRPPWNDAYDRQISWVAEPVPEWIPVHDGSDYDEADDTDEPRGHPSAPQPSEIETSPEVSKLSHIPLSPSSAIVPPETSAMILEWEEFLQVIVTDTTPKKNGETSQILGDGHRLIVFELANNTDSSTSRGSDASLTSASKPDKDLASLNIPSSPAVVSKYDDNPKLLAFPGIVKRLEEERRTRDGLPLNASSPDIASPPTVDEFSPISSSGSVSSRTPQASPEIRSCHSQLDMGHSQKFIPGGTPPALSSPSTSTTQPDPTTPPTPNNPGLLGGKLPTNRETTKRLLIAKGLLPSQRPSPHLQQPVPTPVVISRPGSTDVCRKPYLSDLINSHARQRVPEQIRPRIRQPRNPSLDKLLYDSSRVVADSSLSSSSPERFLESTSARTPGMVILEPSPVLQVANSNTVKDCLLFLFNDILIVTKLAPHDYDVLLDCEQALTLRLEGRSSPQLTCFFSRNPLVRSFVVQFAKDADNGISHFFKKSGIRDDPVVLGQLLFRLLDLDRAKVGDYLSRWMSKVVLKVFIGCFGFGGVQIDKALHVFLRSLHLAPPSRFSNPLEYVSDSFASHWREPLSQACDTVNSMTQDQRIILKRPIPSRLTYHLQSEPIIVRIPQADPSLASFTIQANKLIFDPPYLSFTRSTKASFRITGTALSLKTVSFSRSGTTALLYMGLPLSSPIMIERSFMRNTFQVAFVNHQGSKCYGLTRAC
ncbi:hypothetical protein BGW80DRAFT_1470979 [Lactifluus volemus]|nr:hypothetical protein BGW80DRAFT_1470979 [Lactifluus volemus]